MVGWHHQLNGHEFEQALEVDDGQESLVCSSPWGHRVGHDWATELNWRIVALPYCVGFLHQLRILGRTLSQSVVYTSEARVTSWSFLVILTPLIVPSFIFLVLSGMTRLNFTILIHCYYSLVYVHPMST